MKKLICFFKGHKRGRTQSWTKPMSPFTVAWVIECSRCGHQVEYESPLARLVGEELRLGFDGN